MKLSCNVIRDLLPLYAENLTSEESNALVDEHLCGCDECAKQLGILKKAQAIPVETDAPGLKKIRKISAPSPPITDAMMAPPRACPASPFFVIS